MASRTQRIGEELRETRGGKAAAAPPAERDLDSEEVQNEILHPETVEITFAGKKVRLHKLSGYASRSLLGLAGELLTDRSLGSGAVRFRLMQPSYLARFLTLFAAAHGAAGELTTEEIDKIARELDDNSASAKGAVELANAFDAMCDQNGIREAIAPPKNDEPPPKAAATK